MHLIFSILEDPSTTEVMRWMRHLGAEDIVRVNSDDIAQEPTSINLDGNGFRLSVNGRDISQSEIESVWYRKGSFWFNGLYPEVDIEHHPKLTNAIKRSNRRENREISDYFHFLLARSARVLGSVKNSSLNKLITSELAKTIGLDTPVFTVVNRCDHAAKILGSGKPHITKAIGDGTYIWDQDEAMLGYFSYTERLSIDMLSCYGVYMPPSLIQEEIPKELELRIFFLDGIFYPTAIFSQSDEKTTVDFRKYNDENPNRNVPFSLPEEIAEKLRVLFKSLDLNTGSVDMIIGKDGRYYFLEINPVGQFEYPGNSCGYHIERDIAKWLMRS
jgi:ATP-GRASP peptide maturase of grasp-with-spasm system